MKNLSLFTLVFALTALFFSSCEKENDIKDIASEKDTEAHAQLPAEAFGTEPVAEIDSFFKEIVTPEIEIVSDSAYIERTDNPVVIKLEKGQLEKNSSIGCGSDFTSSTGRGGNHVTSWHYSRFGLNADLDGEDRLYTFYVGSTVDDIDFLLTNTYRNLAMILFKNSSTCTSGSCLQSLVAYTTSSSTTSDGLYNIRLTPGHYTLVVDNPIYGESSFRLRMKCPTPSCFKNKNDSFSSYYTGNLTPQASHWEKWNASSYCDAYVYGNYNYARLYYDNGCKPDVLLKLCNHSNGFYRVKFDMWVPYYRSAYFNVQKRLSYGNTSNEFGGQVYFNSNGSGRLSIAGRNYNFNYPKATWFRVEIAADLWGNSSLYVNGYRVVTYPTRYSSNTIYGSNRMSAIDFYTPYTDSDFYIDNVQVTDY
ncbi:MAG: hypothetical protein AAF849_05705 [Bacteroidota bacterium]